MKIPKAIAKYIDVVNHPGYYIRVEVERMKANAQEKMTEVISKLIILAAIALLALFVLVFLSITAGLLINDALNSAYLGFLIVTGFYALVLTILLLVKDSLEKQLLQMAKKSVVVPVKNPQQIIQGENKQPSPDQTSPESHQEIKSNGHATAEH
ncbi:phage holin family protein [Tunicatimonas pelagia]|uniref:phage holin family protein n=1 Tax=Tunicatimonas pelagia TaxID=931531 RepID=UPI002665E0E8|nr:phage holin family protein [Tunicatimonas pelagia]WKN40527.1 phage holin family protein [Tunicatimonas pelagia]